MSQPSSNPNTVKVTLIKGVEGMSLYVNDYRIAGPKPWGGGSIVKEWHARRDDIGTALGMKVPTDAGSDR